MGTIDAQRSYERYIHTLKIAWRLIANRDCSDVLPSFEEVSGDDLKTLKAAAEGMRERLAALSPDLCADLLPSPYFQQMQFGAHTLKVPIINKEGEDWYAVQNVMNFDFLTETFAGLHKDARIIYDIGGHQGVFALYYSGLIERSGRVYTFEPSIINIEIAALSFLVNRADNIVLVPMGVGPRNDTIRSDTEGLLVAGAPTNMLLVRPDWMLLERPDFIKIDIEGFEHELIQSMPWLFDLCDNFHLEIHVPHLKSRGVDYREIYDAIPFDKFRVRHAEWGRLTDLTAESEIDGFAALLLTTKSDAAMIKKPERVTPQSVTRNSMRDSNTLRGVV